MQIQVLFFGVLKDLIGRSSESLELAEGAKAGAVLRHYSQRAPRIAAMMPSVALSVNQEYVTADVPLHSGDEVALLPPVSGGLGEARPDEIRIVHETIDAAAIISAVKRPEDGAAVIFDGVVRNNTRGRRTLYLDYEAYEEMALKQMRGLAEEARSKFGVRQVALVHR